MSPSSSKLINLTPDHPSLDAIISGIVHLHANCIIHDNTMATFLPPLSYKKMEKWWQDRVSEIAKRQRHFIVMLGSSSNPSPKSVFTDETTAPEIQINSNSTTYQVTGLVTLVTPYCETGPFRGIVEKFFVSPWHRRQGIGRALMAELEDVAARLGRWNLMLDTEVGQDAELVYPRLGWERVGVVKCYGYSPRPGSKGREGCALMDNVWFSKDLRDCTN